MPASAVNISMNRRGLKGRMIETTVARAVVVLPNRRDVARLVGSHQQVADGICCRIPEP